MITKQKSKTIKIKNNIDWENDINWENGKFSIWVSLDGRFFSNWTKLLGNSQNDILQIEAVKKVKERDESKVKAEVKYLPTYDYKHYLPKKERDQIRRIPISYSKSKDQIVLEKLGLKTVYNLTDRQNIPPNWTGNSGYIDGQTIIKEVPDYKERMYYLSGPQSMIVSFEKTLAELGVPNSHIKKDFFPGLV